MTRRVRNLALLSLLSSLAGVVPARAQYYPPGYGGYGWGGWGGHTVAGSTAAGMGQFAAGAGQYNAQTAQARSINAQTAMGLNNYVYEVNQQHLQTYYTEQARRQKKQDTGWHELQDR